MNYHSLKNNEKDEHLIRLKIDLKNKRLERDWLILNGEISSKLYNILSKDIEWLKEYIDFVESNL